MTIEEALLKSHCGDPHGGSCAGTIVIRENKTILACKRCGTETRNHQCQSQVKTCDWEHRRRKELYELVLREIAASL